MEDLVVRRSDGTPVRDYIYVEDAVSAYLLLAEQLAANPTLAGEAFNFSNDSPLAVRALVDRILARTWVWYRDHLKRLS